MWRDSARPPQLFMLDYRATFTLLLFVFHMAFWTLLLAVIVFALIALIQRFDYTPPVALRYVRALCAGRRRPTTDFGIITTAAVWKRRWNS